MMMWKAAWFGAGALIAGVGAASVVLATTRSEAPMVRPPASLWGGTSLGAAFCWPTGFDPDRVASPPSYSPSGTSAAIRTDDGRLHILDLSSGVLHDLYSDIGDTRDNLSCEQVGWLSEDKVYVLERSCSNAALEGWVPTPPQRAPGGRDWRVIDVRTGEVVQQHDLGSNSPSFQFVSALDENEWIVFRLSDSDWKNRMWLFHPSDQSFNCVLAQGGENESIRFIPGAPWIATTMGSSDTNPWAAATNMTLFNILTGEDATVSNLPHFSSYGPKVTADGEMLITATFEPETGRSRPIVIDTRTNIARALPQTESWIPAGVNESRDVLLVAMATAHDDGSYSTEWAEVPLNALRAP